MINHVSAGLRNILEEDYEGFMLAVVHMHDTFARGYEGFGTKKGW